jgi:hypothetical protein
MATNTIASTTYLEVNSLDRNISKHPNPSQYRIDLQDTIRNVQKLTLIGGTIPINNYNVYQYNNCFDVSFGGSVTTVTLEQGNYTLSEMATMIENVLQSDVNVNFTVTSNANTNTFTFANSAGAFQFLFSVNQCATVTDSHTGAILNIPNSSVLLGFDPRSVPSSSGVGNTLVSTYSVSLNSPERIYLYVNQNHTADYSNIKQTRRKRQLYGIIYVNDTALDMQILNEETTRFFSQTYGGQDLRYMDIEFRDQFDNLYDFQNKQHTLLFRIDVTTPGIIPNNAPPFIKNVQINEFKYPI